ncbi:glycosyltransferase family 4 protein [Teichococcus vastitatis]|uniref:Glycosyltransferase family 4 protein n=1 Tax=Teichococcus vastitatis TaxID=2307076 RepID=A0ABS9W9G6_9PROT|nr:glycosyltransferase family 4 protein [Pseudoroseomonas vastitatis]MCI0755946.1 glycosyltransferase family 4 protein [Pseudoroseomonas vastitatis]
MDVTRSPLGFFSPLPPEKNGIADYSYILLNEIRKYYDISAFCDDPAAQAPDGVRVRDQQQSYRHITPDSRVLHQIGNNAGHVFVLRALRQFPGLTTIHDIGLFYLYELEQPGMEGMLAEMGRSAPLLAPSFGRHWKRLGLKTKANYALFDMQRELLARSTGVVVHSLFAKAKLSGIYGEAATRHVSVIPHFAPPVEMADQQQARDWLGLPQDAFIVTTSGFATNAKRFDWLMQALEQVLAQGTELRWIHAGEERAEEYDLSAELARFPLLKQRSQITGYVDEPTLNAHVSACDVLVNLRFPSVGESSGSLARAFSAGRCCLVTDTASYRELPREAVVHLPLMTPVPSLVAALSALHKDPALLRAIGDNARRYAETTLSLEVVGRQYRDAIEEAARRPLSRPGLHPPPRPLAEPACLTLDGTALQDRARLARSLQQQHGPCRVLLTFDSLAELARASREHAPLLGSVLPDHVKLLDTRILSGAARSDDQWPAGMAGTCGILLHLDVAGEAA